MTRAANLAVLAALLLLLCACGPAAAAKTKLRYSARLLPKNEVLPPNGTIKATGSFKLTFTKTEPRGATWTLDLRKLLGKGLTPQTLDAAHIHAGAAGQNGPIIAVLFSGGVGGLGGRVQSLFLTDTLATITGTSFEIVYGLLANKTALYVNVHSQQNPGGFLRGQLK